MSRPPFSCLAMAMAVALNVPSSAARAQSDNAVFALIIGSNQSVDTEEQPLRYADDDAARYLELFRVLGAKAHLLSRLDDNTSRLHPQAAAEAKPPRSLVFDEVTMELARDVQQAHARGLKPILYFVFAGHGSSKGDEGYIALEDERLTGSELSRRVVARIGAVTTHIIIDACRSYLVAYGRGPGGSRRDVSGFSQLTMLSNHPDVGLVLSSSSAKDSHEWEGYEAGVFSHEVRSGLYGAADADGDGSVSYQEIAAFVSRANESIVSDRFRPMVHARAPARANELINLRTPTAHRVRVDGALAAHYLVEDSRGIRVLDFHNAPGHSVELLRPSPPSPLYFRRLDTDEEFLVKGGEKEVSLGKMKRTSSATGKRGAAHEAFRMLFALPFTPSSVKPLPQAPYLQATPETSSLRPTRVAALAIWGVGLASAAGGAAVHISSAQDAKRARGSTVSQLTANELNQSVERKNTAAIALYSVAGAAALGGVLLWVLPPSKVNVTPSFNNGAQLTVSGVLP